MKLTPGTIIAYDWFNAVIYIVEVSKDSTGSLEIVEKPMPLGAVRLIDVSTGKDIDHVTSYNVATRQVVQYETRNGEPFIRVNRATGEEHIAVIVERRELRVMPVGAGKPVGAMNPETVAEGNGDTPHEAQYEAEAQHEGPAGRSIGDA